MICPVWKCTIRECLPPRNGPTKPSFRNLRITSLGLSGVSLAMLMRRPRNQKLLDFYPLDPWDFQT